MGKVRLIYSEMSVVDVRDKFNQLLTKILAEIKSIEKMITNREWFEKEMDEIQAWLSKAEEMATGESNNNSVEAIRDELEKVREIRRILSLYFWNGGC